MGGVVLLGGFNGRFSGHFDFRRFYFLVLLGELVDPLQISFSLLDFLVLLGVDLLLFVKGEKRLVRLGDLNCG